MLSGMTKHLEIKHGGIYLIGITADDGHNPQVSMFEVLTEEQALDLDDIQGSSTDDSVLPGEDWGSHSIPNH